MRLILSPAKKMNQAADTLAPVGLPVFLDRTRRILQYLQALDRAALKNLWQCSDKLTDDNVRRLEALTEDSLVSAQTPAMLAYEGIAYQHMAPTVFEDAHIAYVEEHLRILSAFYGVLKPLDAVMPYRLEMQAAASVGGTKDLYAFWADALYREIRDDSGVFVNLASQEYAKAVLPYLGESDRCIHVNFVEENGRTKATFAKMARGEMVRYMAEHAVTDPADIRGFDRLGFHFHPEMSDDTRYVFVRSDKKDVSVL